MEFLERTKVFWTPHMTDYQWEPIGLLVDPMEDVRKLRNHPEDDSKETAVLMHFNWSYWREPKFSGLLT